MNKEYPLYPELSEEAKKQAKELIESFKKQIIVAAGDAIGELYSDILPWIESDTWQNFRNQIIDGMRNYNNRKIQSQYDFGIIREEIYKQFRDDIIKDLDQDNLEKIAELKVYIEKLKEQLETERRMRGGY